MRDYDPTTGQYIQADPLGLVDGASVYGYAGQNPGRYVDPRGEEREDHKSGRWIQCSANCRIRIDYVVVNGTKVRHLHWDCRGSSGTCGEYGEKSHGQGWEDAPKEVKQCAIGNGFFGQSAKPLSSIADIVILGVGAALFAPASGSIVGGGLVLGAQ